MANKFYLSIGVALSFIIISCGTGKKLEAAEAKINEANAKNAQLNNNIDQLNAQVASLTQDKDHITSDFVRYRQQCEGISVKYKSANSILRQQETILKQIDEKLESALTDLEGRGLSVHYKRGLLFVSMEDDLLYKSGSSKLDQKGIDALAKIATVLNDYPDVKIIVVGNTDDMKFKNGSDNWSLSTERANSVVRVLRDVYSTDPARMTSAGRGKFNPVEDNGTAEGRAKNRRTDIIFNPDMDKVWDSLDL
jgi:chemotaxis protein MotB